MHGAHEPSSSHPSPLRGRLRDKKVAGYAPESRETRGAQHRQQIRVRLEQRARERPRPPLRRSLQETPDGGRHAARETEAQREETERLRLLRLGGHLPDVRLHDARVAVQKAGQEPTRHALGVRGARAEDDRGERGSEHTDEHDGPPADHVGKSSPGVSRYQLTDAHGRARHPDPSP